MKKSLDLQYLSVEVPQQIWISGLLRDISETGLNFSSDKNFQVSQIIKVRIRFPFNPLQWIECAGRCVDSRALSIGIYIIRMEFLDLEEERQKAIRDYLNWLLKKEL